jgi:hypothetical protein
LFANERVLLSESEDNLQGAFYTVHNTTEQFEMEISPLKSEVIACKGKSPIRKEHIFGM